MHEPAPLAPAAPAKNSAPIEPVKTQAPVVPAKKTALVVPTKSPTPVAPVKTQVPVVPTKSSTPVAPAKTSAPVAPAKSPAPVLPGKTPAAPRTDREWIEFALKHGKHEDLKVDSQRPSAMQIARRLEAQNPNVPFVLLEEFDKLVSRVTETMAKLKSLVYLAGEM